jgi:aubergine-like protein
MTSKANGAESESMMKEIKAYEYPIIPKRNNNLRNEPKVQIITNLFPIEYLDKSHKMYIYSIEIFPTVSDENFPLKRLICQHLEGLLPSEFKKVIFAGNNLYACVENFKQEFMEFKLSTSVQKEEYQVILRQSKEIDFNKLDDDEKTNQQLKSIIEKLMRFIIMHNPNVIKFKDGTLVNVNPDNIQSLGSSGDNSTEKIFRGYMTSIQITENGFYMRINDVNKIISGKTALRKINEIINSSKENNSSISFNEVKNYVNEYFAEHRTVLAKYGNYRTYKISNINFDKTPSNTSISIKDINGNEVTLNLVNYYNKQYGIKIKDENQALIEVKRPKKGAENEEETIYLIPELVYLTGVEDSNFGKDKSTRNRITSKTKMNPLMKINAIKSINDLINSDVKKVYKNKKGDQKELKSAKEIKDIYGIRFGNNLTIQGRLIPQPNLLFNGGNKVVTPKNGLFRSECPNRTIRLTNNNLFFLYEEREKADCQNLFMNIMQKCRTKGFTFAPDFHPKKVAGYSISMTKSWDKISDDLSKALEKNNGHEYGIIFLSQNLSHFYERLKNYFYKRNIVTQFCLTRKVNDRKIGNSIQFNIIEQFNIKMGGENHRIHFVKENVMKNTDIYLVIGLKSQVERRSNKIKYCMTSTKSQFLNSVYTSVKECNNTKQDRQELLKAMFKEAISTLTANTPHNCPPNFVFLYRKGGNYLENIKLAIDEKDVFINVIKELENANKNMEIPFYYICCNLKCDLKFFEYNDSNNHKGYFNPKSGLIIDENVTQKNKFEFFVQPQFVNQGTATPAHYQVMCAYKHSDDKLKLEQLERITFYLCYYYFTWSGAIREPGTLKMAETALDFSSKCFDNSSFNYFFNNPSYL